MIKIEDIDSNFKIETLSFDDAVYFNCMDEPVEINGLYRPKELGYFTRMPKEYEDMQSINPGARALIGNTAGGRIRFSTDSPYLCVLIEVSSVTKVSHMSILGNSGADIYVCERGKDDYRYKKSVMPEKFDDDSDRLYKGVMKFENYDSYKEHEVMIHLPLYNGVKSVYIGVKKDCRLYSPVEYKSGKLIGFYGASITQGGCASRPGNNYPNHLSRWLKADFVNLGFSGSAKGEPEIAEYLAKLGADALFIDLDMSSKRIEDFINAHYAFYKCIREYNKTVPLIFMSFPRYPKVHHSPESGFRDHIVSNNIILETILNARNAGDENVYYIDGETLFGAEDQDSCTVDYTHPNDLGFYMMAKGIYPVLKKALGL